MNTKPIEGFPNYTVSEDGRVFSLRYKRHIKPKYYLGYLIVSLWDGYKIRNKRVHRLVLEAFVGPCPDGCEAAHLDGNSHNNNILNLAWLTHKENVSHRKIHGTSADGERNGSAKLCAEDVRKIVSMIDSGICHREIGKKFNVSRTTIGFIGSGKTWVTLTGSPHVNKKPGVCFEDAICGCGRRFTTRQGFYRHKQVCELAKIKETP